MKDIKLAIDLGTTTIDMCLIDASENIISQRSIKNRQSLYGGDVINRILTTVRDSKYIKIMKDMVLDDMAENINSMLTLTGIDSRAVTGSLICGNATMISILLEYNLKSMGEYPFETNLKGACSMDFSELFSHRTNIKCPLILSGCVSAFIGGDIISGIIYLKDKFNAFGFNDNSLFIDLGTNGEMVINAKGKLYATSASCGPAFESAIKKQNAYGTSLIDAIALGVKSKNISINGILTDEYLVKGINISGININSSILEDILSAKAAIRTGIDYLLEEANINYENLDNVFIAGGFGQYLSIENAVYIGMLPEGNYNNTRIVGNTSLMGACRLLVHDAPINKMNGYTNENIKVLQLAKRKDYQDRLINNMFLKRS